MRNRACLLAVFLALSASGCGLSAEDAEDEDADGAVEGEEASAEALTGSDFPAPDLTVQEKTAIFASYHVDPDGLVPRPLLIDAVAFFDHNKEKLTNRSFITVVDFSKHSGKRRMFVVNMRSGAVSSYVVAHGSNSDPARSGFATRFSNTQDSKQSSLGFYVTGETYSGKHGKSLRLDGVSSTNSRARARAIVVHGASYVGEGRAMQGRSWGCLALPDDEKDDVIAMLKGGSVIYAARPN